MDISGKTAIVTGAASGIGLGIATALAEAGANVVKNGVRGLSSRNARAAKLAKSSRSRVRYPCGPVSAQRRPTLELISGSHLRESCGWRQSWISAQSGEQGFIRRGSNDERALRREPKKANPRYRAIRARPACRSSCPQLPLRY